MYFSAMFTVILLEVIQGLQNGLFSPSTRSSEKNAHLQFLSYLHEWCVDLNKKAVNIRKEQYSDNVEIRYSLWPMV